MIYTPKPPTESGSYLHKEHETDNPITCWCNEKHTFFVGQTGYAVTANIGGLWCQLTCKASAQQRLATEVEKAYKEGFGGSRCFGHGDSRTSAMEWPTSRAARVSKGKL